MSLEDDMAALSRAPFIGEIGRDALRLLAFSAERIELRAGDILFDKGQRADGGYVVTNGRLVLLPGEGRPEREVGPGTLIGELALVIDTERPVTAIARVPTRLFSIPRTLFRRMLEEYPAIAGTLGRYLAARMSDDSVALEDVRARLDALDLRGSR
jgi:CRP-like cAMP-binding protein